MPKKKTVMDMTEDMKFRVAYLPYVIAEIAWDFADTIYLLCSGVDKKWEVKEVTDGIRKLRKHYVRYVSRFIDADHQREYTQHCERLQEEQSPFFSRLATELSMQIEFTYPRLSRSEVHFLTTVYTTLVVIEAYKRYIRWADNFLDDFCQEHGTTTLPPQINPLAKLIRLLLGDCDKAVTLDDLQPSIDEFYNYLLKLKNNANNSN
jgi:hypothetical protein